MNTASYAIRQTTPSDVNSPMLTAVWKRQQQERHCTLTSYEQQLLTKIICIEDAIHVQDDESSVMVSEW